MTCESDCMMKPSEVCDIVTVIIRRGNENYRRYQEKRILDLDRMSAEAERQLAWDETSESEIVRDMNGKTQNED